MNNFKNDLYKALSDILFKYRDYPIAEAEHKDDLKAIMNDIIDKFYEDVED